MTFIRTWRRTLRRTSSSTFASPSCDRFGRPTLGEDVSYFLGSQPLILLFSVANRTICNKSTNRVTCHTPLVYSGLTSWRYGRIHSVKACRISDMLPQLATVAKWYVVPMVWAPITIYLFLCSLFQFAGSLPAFTVNPALPLSSLSSIPSDAFVKTLLCFFTGNLIWTILEYGLHRFLFHIDEMLPDRPTRPDCLPRPLDTQTWRATARKK